jgi:hypothetical protein
MREKRGAPFQRVRILENVRADKWRAEWIDPNPGLIDFVQSGHVLCPWKELKALVAEETGETALREHNRRVGYRDRSPIDNALSCVFEAVGDDVSFFRGVLTGRPDALDRIRTRAGVPLGSTSPAAYVDRAGVAHIPLDEALELARRFAAAEPATVLADAEVTERKWARDATVPGEDHIIGLLNEYRAAWALIRQWAGHDAAVAQREAEIQRLQRLVWDAIYALQKAGLDREAARLRRAIGPD